MRLLSRDLWQMAFGAVRAHRLRSALSMLGIAIAVAAVSVLTAMGEGTRRYIVGEFAQFGTNLLSVSPGRVTTGGIPGGVGVSQRQLAYRGADAARDAAGGHATGTY